MHILPALFTASTLAMSLTAAPPTARTNPLMTASTLPFQAPPFDKLTDADLQPAIEEGMRIQRAEVRKIAENPAPPTFRNTLVALEKSGQLLVRANLILNTLAGANTDPTLQKLQETEAPRLSAHRDATYLDAKLFHRIERVYAQRDQLKLDPESRRLVEFTYQAFVHAGAKLSDADKASLRQLNEEDSSLSAQFVNRLMAASKAGALVVEDKARLAGLSEADLAAAAQAAQDRKLAGKWVLTLKNTTQQPLLQDLSDRATREALFRASWNRAEKGDANDTRELLTRLAQLRAQKARLLGYPSFAAWQLSDQMAKTPEAALAFMRDLVPAATARAEAEAKDIQAVIDAQKGGFQVQAWDWQPYAEQVRKAKYDLDDSQIKPYFELDRVLKDGVFYAAHLLYGISFRQRHDLPVYHPDVRVFDVFDKDKKHLALFYCDFYKRDNKNGGAWMDNMVGQSRLLHTQPVVFNVCNFTKPAAGQPALISFDDVITMFHEFGHALHGMFANQVYPSLSGTAVARDFVEFPSQFNEYWATEPKVFAHYARHFKTGEVMPPALVAKIKKAGTFNKGYEMTELISAALLDMDWHSLSADAPRQDADGFEAGALKKDRIDLSYVPPRYRSSIFLHIWGNGYSAGYYAYLWTQMLSDDAFQWFKEHGGLTRANGDRFRRLVLSRGNTEDLGKMFRDFRGADPNVAPMLLNRGLKAESVTSTH